ncbi:MAG: HAD hydrolase-like protein [Haliscomenobacter sp.]|jgi:phosphonatase-like hydrolase|nr:HAD hydrolase-like protein [Haliscomenobacter sp.]
MLTTQKENAHTRPAVYICADIFHHTQSLVMHLPIELVAFDMAGTTVQDHHEVESCFREAAQITGLHMTEEEIRSVQGWSKRFVFETFWERQLGQRDEVWAEHVDHGFQVFRDILETHYLTQPVEPTEGALETFAFLREHGVQIALTTGFYRKVADIILNKLGWLNGLDERYVGSADSLIQFSVSSDQVAHGRPHPDMIFKSMEVLGIKDASRVIAVGDTPSDIQAGQAAGCAFSVALANGTHDPEALSPFKPDALLPSLKDFASFLQEKAFLIKK